MTGQGRDHGKSEAKTVTGRSCSGVMPNNCVSGQAEVPAYRECRPKGSSICVFLVTCCGRRAEVTRCEGGRTVQAVRLRRVIRCCTPSMDQASVVEAIPARRAYGAPVGGGEWPPMQVAGGGLNRRRG